MICRLAQIATLVGVVIALIVVSIYAEEFILAAGCDFTRFVRVDPVAGSVSQAEQTNFRANFMVRYGYASINGDGSVLVTDKKIVTIDATGTKTINIPGSDSRTYGYPCLDYSGRFLVYEKLTEGTGSIVLFDTVNQVTVDIRKYIGAESLTQLAFSANGDIVAYSYFDYPIPVLILERNEEGRFAAPVEVARHEFVHELFLSSSGQRLFYQGSPLKTYVVKRTSSGWGKPETVEVPGVDYINWLRDVANDGKTLLASVGNQLALIHETETGWSEPEYLPLGGEAKISEDGSVVAVIVQRPVYVSDPHNWRDVDVWLLDYDLFVLFRQSPSVWVKHQVNPPEHPIHTDFLLSGDGRMLYWSLPGNPSSGVPNSAWRLHK